MPANPVLNDKRFEKVIADGYGTAPPARTMTLGGTLSALGVLFALICVSGWVGWSQVDQTTQDVFDTATRQTVTVSTTSFPTWTIFAALLAMGFAFATIFKPNWGPVTAPLYALLQGVFLGAISAYYNLLYDGIVVQAVLATLSVVLVMLFLYVTRIVKVTPKFVLITLAATGGIMVMYLMSWIFSIFGANITFWNQPTPLGIGISVVICIVAAMNLALDFAFIEQSVKAGNTPRRMEWLAALGVTVTIVWLYLEILRLFSLLRN
ncbi:MAG: Bax inhibitor-1/YccA family protein [Acidimicrobiales bacterium]